MGLIITRAVQVTTSDGSAAFEVYPVPVASDEKTAIAVADNAGSDIIVTNETATIDDIIGNNASIAVDELYRLVFPASGAETVDQMAAENNIYADSPAARMWQLAQLAESKLNSLPLWALEFMAVALKEADEVALATLCRAVAQKVSQSGNWNDTFPQLAPKNERAALPELSDCTPIDPTRLTAFADRNGRLASVIPGYEPRQGQLEMIAAVADSFNNGHHLLVEAGTGVGKSIGYLVPVAAWASLNDTPVVVSTNTRNLQTQLIENDIPLLRQALGPERGDNLRAVLLKGRSNYLCLRRLGLLLDHGYMDLDRAEMRQFARTVAWAAQTDDGDLDSLSGGCGIDSTFVASLGSSGEECPGRACRYFRRCMVRRIREKAACAHIIVANHALVFADAGESGGVILPPHRQLIFDEAHNLEDAATRHFSTEVSANKLRILLRRLVAEHRKRTTGILPNLQKHLSGSGGENPHQSQILKDIRTARNTITRVREAGSDLFEALAESLDIDTDVNRIRSTGSDAAPVTADNSNDLLDAITPPAKANPRPVVAGEIRRRGMFREWTSQEGHLKVTEAAVAFNDALHYMGSLLDQIAEGLQATMEGELALYNDQAAEVSGAAKMIRAMAADLLFTLAASAPGYVFWIELVRNSETATYSRKVQNRSAALMAAPLNVGAALEEHVYRQKESVVFCSATLRVGNRFNFISNRLGLDLIAPDRLRACLATSPFNYTSQCLTMAAPFLPDPRSGAETAVYVEQLSGLMLDLFSTMRGRSLALFTSYQMMRQCANILEQPLADAGIRLLVQAKGISRDQITRSFRHGAASVLFGAQSFWEGVDVVGEALSCVVIARLPFMAIGDPIVEARCEAIDNNGGSSFREFSVPTAVIRFRQGFGRLIRSTSDRGIVVIADPRIATKSYGRRFIESLPCAMLRTQNRDDLLSRTQNFITNPEL